MVGRRFAAASAIASRRYASRRSSYESERMLEIYTEEELTVFRNRRTGIFRKTKAGCSCSMCGNPRRHFGEVTFQELKAAESAREQMSEMSSYAFSESASAC